MKGIFYEIILNSIMINYHLLLLSCVPPNVYEEKVRLS